MTEKQKMVGTEPKKSVLKNRLKTLAKVGIAAAAVTLGSKVQAAQGSPMRRGYATPQVETITQSPVQYVGGGAVVDRSMPIFGQGSRGGMVRTVGTRSSKQGKMPHVGGRSVRHGAVPHVTGHTVRTGTHGVSGYSHGYSTRGSGRGFGSRGGGRGFGPRGGGHGFGPRGGGRSLRPRGRGRGF